MNISSLEANYVKYMKMVLEYFQLMKISVDGDLWLTIV